MKTTCWAAYRFGLDFIPRSAEEFRQYLISNKLYNGEKIEERGSEIWITLFTDGYPAIPISSPYPWHDGNGYARVTQRGDGMYYRW